MRHLGTFVTAAVAMGPACGDGIEPQEPTSVLDHLVAGKTWITDRRVLPPFHSDCPECRFVRQITYTRDATGLVSGRFQYFFDAPAGREADTFDVTLELHPREAPDIDPLERVAVEGVKAPSTSISIVFDAPRTTDPAGPSFVSFFFADTSESSTLAWPGWPESNEDLRYAENTVRCSDADRVPGRGYCMPSCDFKGADPGRSECSFPEFLAPPFAQCNDVVQSNALVAQTRVATEPPSATGGPLIAGTYQLTSWTSYTGATGATGPTGYQQAMAVRIQDQTAEVAMTGTTGTDWLNIEFVNSGNNAILVQRCPDFGRPPIDTFTAAGDSLILHDTGGRVAFELTRVP